MENNTPVKSETTNTTPKNIIKETQQIATENSNDWKKGDKIAIVETDYGYMWQKI